MIRVLVYEYVTGGGLANSELPESWAAEGSAMRRAIAKELAAVAGVAVTMAVDPRCLAAEPPMPHVEIVPGESKAGKDRLTDWVSDAKFDAVALIAPESDGILCQHQRWLEAASIASLGPSAEVITLAADKLALERHWRAQGVATTESQMVALGQRWPDRRPAVVKPRDGAGCLDTWFLNHGDSGTWIPDQPDRLWQPWIPGRSLSATVLALGQQREPILVGVAEQTLIVDQGRILYQGGRLPATIDTDAVESLVLTSLAGLPSLTGLIGIDFIADVEKREFSCIELNPRPTTSSAIWMAWHRPGLVGACWLAASIPDRFSWSHFEELRAKIALARMCQWVFSADGKILMINDKLESRN